MSKKKKTLSITETMEKYTARNDPGILPGPKID